MQNGKYSITIQLPNGNFFAIQYDDEKTATAFLQQLAKDASESSLDEVIAAITPTPEMPTSGDDQ